MISSYSLFLLSLLLLSVSLFPVFVSSGLLDVDSNLRFMDLKIIKHNPGLVFDPKSPPRLNISRRRGLKIFDFTLWDMTIQSIKCNSNTDSTMLSLLVDDSFKYESFEIPQNATEKSFILPKDMILRLPVNPKGRYCKELIYSSTQEFIYRKLTEPFNLKKFIRNSGEAIEMPSIALTLEDLYDCGDVLIDAVEIPVGPDEAAEAQKNYQMRHTAMPMDDDTPQQQGTRGSKRIDPSLVSEAELDEADDVPIGNDEQGDELVSPSDIERPELIESNFGNVMGDTEEFDRMQRESTEARAQDYSKWNNETDSDTGASIRSVDTDGAGDDYLHYDIGFTRGWIEGQMSTGEGGWNYDFQTKQAKNKLYKLINDPAKGQLVEMRNSYITIKVGVRFEMKWKLRLFAESEKHFAVKVFAYGLANFEFGIKGLLMPIGEGTRFQFDPYSLLKKKFIAMAGPIPIYLDVDLVPSIPVSVTTTYSVDTTLKAGGTWAVQSGLGDFRGQGRAALPATKFDFSVGPTTSRPAEIRGKIGLRMELRATINSLFSLGFYAGPALYLTWKQTQPNAQPVCKYPDQYLNVDPKYSTEIAAALKIDYGLNATAFRMKILGFKVKGIGMSMSFTPIHLLTLFQTCYPSQQANAKPMSPREITAYKAKVKRDLDKSLAQAKRTIDLIQQAANNHNAPGSTRVAPKPMPRIRTMPTKKASEGELDSAEDMFQSESDSEAEAEADLDEYHYQPIQEETQPIYDPEYFDSPSFYEPLDQYENRQADVHVEVLVN